MNGPVAAVAGQVPDACYATRCDKDGCRIDLTKGVLPARVIVDMDCDGLQIPNGRKRCDYLFFGAGSDVTIVAPIELKSGSLRAGPVLEQLKGGAKMADAWLPQGVSFRLIPIVAHGKRIRRKALNDLRANKIRLRGQRKLAVLIKCGDSLTKALGQ